MKYDYDPAKAKALLAEAGFPNGFDVEMVSYVQPTSWGAAIQNYLNAVGIRAKITQLQVAPAIQKARRARHRSTWAAGAATRSTTCRRSCR